MKKQIEVKMLGLNELGVSEINEFYKDNISEGYFEPFELGDHMSSSRTKRFKQIKDFGPESYLYTVDYKQHIKDDEYGGGWFWVKVKHVDCKISEIEIVETSRKITL
jgi:hypothetical protein